MFNYILFEESIKIFSCDHLDQSLKENTQSAYKTQRKKFTDFCKKQGLGEATKLLGTDLAEAGAKFFRYIGEEKDKDGSPKWGYSTLNQCRSMLVQLDIDNHLRANVKRHQAIAENELFRAEFKVAMRNVVPDDRPKGDPQANTVNDTYAEEEFVSLCTFLARGMSAALQLKWTLLRLVLCQPRPKLNPYMLFTKERKAQLAAQRATENPAEAVDTRQDTKMIAAEWQKLPVNVKAWYKMRADQL